MPATGEVERAEMLAMLAQIEPDADEFRTEQDGTVLIHIKRRTSASYRNPESRAYLSDSWIHVTADGYGGCLVPLRYDEVPVKSVKGHVLPAIIGLRKQ